MTHISTNINAPRDLWIEDYDQDGDKDIAVTNLVNNIYVLINTGDEDDFSFSSPKYIETGRAPWGLDFGDVNGDGLVDIVVATTDASDKLTALINTSAGTNLSYIPYYIGSDDISFNINISDFNGDAKPDIAYINRQNNLIRICSKQRFSNTNFTFFNFSQPYSHTLSS